MGGWAGEGDGGGRVEGYTGGLEGWVWPGNAFVCVCM